jgi:PBP1b-binding outer membrane lipoprotein LpoB
MKYLTRILSLLSIIFLLNGCEADLKTEKQGDKMDAFFQSNNNTSLSVLSKLQTYSKQDLAIRENYFQVQCLGF